MEFRFEDILKNIIPGSIVFTGVLLIILNQITFDCMIEIIKSDLKDYSEVLLFIILTASYLFGYLNDSISSTLEHILYKLIKKPSYYLLTNSCTCTMSRLKIADLDAVLEKIKEKFKIEINNSEENSNQAFKLINQYKKDNDSLKEYYFSYIFSRNIFFASIFLSIAIITSNHLKLEWFYYYPITLCILTILYFRRIEKSFHYSRKVIVGILQTE